MGFGSLGIGETLLILVAALLIFGPRKLPEIGASLGKGIREFRRSINEVKHEISAATEPVQRPTGHVSAQGTRPPSLQAPGETVATAGPAAAETRVEPGAEAAPAPETSEEPENA